MFRSEVNVLVRQLENARYQAIQRFCKRSESPSLKLHASLDGHLCIVTRPQRVARNQGNQVELEDHRAAEHDRRKDTQEQFTGAPHASLPYRDDCVRVDLPAGTS